MNERGAAHHRDAGQHHCASQHKPASALRVAVRRDDAMAVVDASVAERVDGGTSDWAAWRACGFRAHAHRLQCLLQATMSLRLRGFVHEVHDAEHGDVRLLGWPARMSKSAVPIRAAPLLGEHTDQVLVEDLGLGQEAIDGLRERGAIGSEGAAQP